MTLLYGKAANGNYYPVQVSEDGQVVAVQAPGQQPSFDAIELTGGKAVLGQPLDVYKSGKWSPRFISYNELTDPSVTEIPATYSQQTGQWVWMGSLMVFTMFIRLSAITPVASGILAVAGPTIPGLDPSKVLAGTGTFWNFIPDQSTNYTQPRVPAMTIARHSGAGIIFPIASWFIAQIGNSSFLASGLKNPQAVLNAQAAGIYDGG